MLKLLEANRRRQLEHKCKQVSIFCSFNFHHYPVTNSWKLLTKWMTASLKLSVFFDERIKDYEILKWNSTNLSKVNSNMMDKYMKCKFVTWNVFNYFWDLSGKPNSCPILSKNIDMPKESSVRHKETSEYFWLALLLTNMIRQ